jgi:hypothetical protein
LEAALLDILALQGAVEIGNNVKPEEVEQVVEPPADGIGPR